MVRKFMEPERKNEIWAMLPEITKAECRRIFLKESLAKANSYGQGYRDALIDFFGSYNLAAQADEKPKKPRYNIGDKVRINCIDGNGEVWDAVMHNKIVTIQDYYVKNGVNMYVLKEGYRDFGEHCLEPYIEPKEPRFKLGEKVVCCGKVRVVASIERYGPCGIRYLVTEPNGQSPIWFDEVLLESCPSENGEHGGNSVSSCQNCTNTTENGISDSKIQSESAESIETNAKFSNSFQNSTDWNKYRLDLAKELAVAFASNNINYGAIAYEATKIANEIVKLLKEPDNENA